MARRNRSAGEGLRLTREPSLVRSWVAARGGWPSRRLDGGLALDFPGEECRGLRIGWGEFLAVFLAGRYALACSPEPGSTRWALDRERHPPTRPAAASPAAGPAAAASPAPLAAG